MHNIFVIGFSAGGLSPLKEIISSLSKDIRAAILVCTAAADSESVRNLIERQLRDIASEERQG